MRLPTAASAATVEEPPKSKTGTIRVDRFLEPCVPPRATPCLGSHCVAGPRRDRPPALAACEPPGLPRGSLPGSNCSRPAAPPRCVPNAAYAAVPLPNAGPTPRARRPVLDRLRRERNGTNDNSPAPIASTSRFSARARQSDASCGEIPICLEPVRDLVGRDAHRVEETPDHLRRIQRRLGRGRSRAGSRTAARPGTGRPAGAPSAPPTSSCDAGRPRHRGHDNHRRMSGAAHLGAGPAHDAVELGELDRPTGERGHDRGQLRRHSRRRLGGLDGRPVAL
jgi:hypothetical protein